MICDKTQVDQFTKALVDCFLTGEEIVRWQDGERFEDTWPENDTTHGA